MLHGLEFDICDLNRDSSFQWVSQGGHYSVPGGETDPEEQPSPQQSTNHV